MQKKILWLCLPILLILLYRVSVPVKKSSNTSLSLIPSPTHVATHALQQSIFVPYWAPSMKTGISQYAAYYYFGIQPTKEGYIADDLGLQNISLVNTVVEKQKKLVIRMLDASVTEVILQDKTAQQTFSTDLKRILTQHAFSGIVFDIEVPFTLQANKKEQITQFVQLMCTAIKSNYKTCGVLIYGDFLYRKRPYDLAELSKAGDTILLMAYDFHKAAGEPGPNFPFDRRSSKSEGGFDYEYDFKEMIADISTLVPKDKIEVVFGMFGYDWTLNEQGSPLKTAKALSVQEIQSFILNHKAQITKQSQLTQSKEKNIEYVDDEGKKHIIWYEDDESVAVKTKYLLEAGIWQVSFWASSYF
jgi:spore germination protein YaaH